MATVNYTYIPEQAVYVIDSCNDNEFVVSAKVVRVRIDITNTSSIVVYDIRIDNTGTGTKEFLEPDVFLDKATAIVEYTTRIG